jgi:flagellar basal-body rod protein FlgB
MGVTNDVNFLVCRFCRAAIAACLLRGGNGCRFSGIAAGKPRGPVNAGLSKLAWALLKLPTKFRSPRRFPDMSISFDKALGIHEKALGFRAQRAEVLANNIANADTPNYKARDMDFSSVLAAEPTSSRTALRPEHDQQPSYRSRRPGNGDESLQYRTPMQPSIDQNTVDAQLEQSNYAENAVGFQASFTLLNSKFKGLVSALRGE